MSTTSQETTTDATRAQVAVWLVQTIAKCMWGGAGGAVLGLVFAAFSGGTAATAAVVAFGFSFVTVAAILTFPGDPRKA